MTVPKCPFFGDSTVYIPQFVKDQRNNWACMVVIPRVITTRYQSIVNLVLMNQLLPIKSTNCISICMG